MARKRRNNSESRQGSTKPNKGGNGSNNGQSKKSPNNKGTPAKVQKSSNAKGTPQKSKNSSKTSGTSPKAHRPPTPDMRNARAGEATTLLDILSYTEVSSHFKNLGKIHARGKLPQVNT